MKKQFSCDTCDAFGQVILENDDCDYYDVSTCPCCGGEITITESEEADD